MAIGEDPDYLKVMKRNKANHLDPYSHMKVMPIPFSVTGKEMIEHLRSIVDSKRLAINKEEDKLLNQMRIAYVDESGNLDKDGSNTMDLFDALRLACWRYGNKNKNGVN